MSFDFFVKSNIKFGRGAAEKLPELINAYGLKHVMVVYDSGVKAAGIADKVLEQIHKTGAAVTVFDDVIPNPTNEIIERHPALPRMHRWTDLWQLAEEAVLIPLKPSMC